MKHDWVRRPANDAPGAGCYWPRPPLSPHYVRIWNEEQQAAEAAVVTLLALRREGLAPPAPTLAPDEIPF